MEDLWPLAAGGMFVLAVIGWTYVLQSRRRADVRNSRSDIGTADSPEPPTPTLNDPSPAVRSLHGAQSLLEAYRELRARPNLSRIRTIWSADYAIAVEDYFNEESEWLRGNSHVKVERLINAAYISEDVLTHLKALERQHTNLELYTCDEGNFEVFLCEYERPTKAAHHAGILVINDPNDRSPEFGVQFDALADPDVELPLRSLQRWFNAIKKAPISGDEHPAGVWEINAGEYDQYVHRGSDPPILAHFIRAEDAYLEELLLNAPRPVSFVEFGSGTGRTIHHLNGLPSLTGRVERWIGFDVSRAMVEQSATRRREAPPPWQYFFILDSAYADQHFWRGSFSVTRHLNDREYLLAHPFDQDAYAKSHRVFVSLLNTTGVLNAATRATYIRNMFRAAVPGDDIIISVFDKDAFSRHARDLYRGIQPILGPGVEVSETCFDNVAGNFRAGDYFSHWSDEAEIRSLVSTAQGEILEIVPVLIQAEDKLGTIYRCTVPDESAT